MLSTFILTALISSVLLNPVAALANDAETTASTETKRSSDTAWAELNTKEQEPSDYDFGELEEPGRTWKASQDLEWILGGALTFGGEKLADISIAYLNDPQDTKDDEIKVVEITSGEMYYVYTGALIPLPGIAFRTQVTLGYHVDFIKADNGLVKFSRVPLDIIPMWEFEKHRIGLGLTYYFSPKITVTDIPSLDDKRYAEALGSIASYQYKVSQDFSLGARYTEIKLSPIGDGEAISNNATHLSINIEWVF
jgi:hypothetical protein